ncbi:MAG: hypothetical protein IKP79_01210 [Bacilli bacterium]|nr:hypothetical protein [Bacilli bacterium]
MKKILQFLINIIRRRYIYALDVKIINKHKVHKQLLLLNDGDLNPLEVFRLVSSVRNRTYFGFYKKQFKIQYNKVDDTILIRNENNIPITNNGSLLKNITGYCNIYVIYNNGILPLCDLNETIVFLDLENKCLLKETYKFNISLQGVAEVLLASGMILIMTTIKIKGRLINCIYSIGKSVDNAFSDFPLIGTIFYLSINKKTVVTDLTINSLLQYTRDNKMCISSYRNVDKQYELCQFFDKEFDKKYSYNTFLRDLICVRLNLRKSNTWDSQDS